MKIGLLGFPFLDSNKGCEALTYSFISLLSNIVKDDLTIINLWGKDVCMIQKLFPHIKFVGVEFERKNLYISGIRCILKCDIIFDCTFGDNFSDIYSLSFVKQTTRFKELVLKLKKPLVLAPQTIGPFKNRKLEMRAIEVLKKAYLVYSRDKISSDYAYKISGIEPITVTDLAFLLPYDKAKYSFDKEKNIGINVSGLLWKGGFSKNNQFELKVDYQMYISELINVIMSMGYKIHFIPHVIATDLLPHDDDVEICVKLAKKYDMVCAPIFMNPIEAKSYIANMDIFIGARMHATIAAFSSGVITIPFSYSRKFEGLYNNLGYKYIINAKTDSTEEAIKKTIFFINNKEMLRDKQSASINRINELEKKFEKSLAELLYKIV